MSDLRLIRGASNSRFGGVHWFEWKPKDEVTVGPPAPDLLLLHPLPHDGAYFSTIAPYLAAGRTVIAADYPGYGKSDPVPGEASVRDWADAMLDTLAARSPHGAADLLGFRAGCLVAAEMGLRGAEAVRRLVLVDVPASDAEGRVEVPERPGSMDGPGPVRYYPLGERLRRVANESLVISTGLAAQADCRAAARSLPHARLVELPGAADEPLSESAARVSEEALVFLVGGGEPIG